MAQRSYRKLTKRLCSVARRQSVEMETLGEFIAGGNVYPMFLMHLGSPGHGRLGVTISAGIHGDEPAGVEAAVRFLESNAGNDRLLSEFYFIVFPCDNPSGWELDIRENADGVDLNREFAAPHPAPEVALIMRSLEGKCFDIVFEMHEDVDSPGFYLYELANNPSQQVGEAVIEAVRAMDAPVNLRHIIEGKRAKGGIIRPNVKWFRKTHLPKAVYTYKTCGGHVMTLEPPASILPFEKRVEILLVGLYITLEAAGYSHQ